MTTETPHDEVLIEAAKRTGIGVDDLEWLRGLYSNGGSFTPLCDMIQKYEKPPTDRKVLCAREALAEASIAHADVMWTDEDIATRAIELYEEGFGK
jgi:hypothetical protein